MTDPREPDAQRADAADAADAGRPDPAAPATATPEPAAPATPTAEPAAPATATPEPAAPATATPEPAAPATATPDPAAPATATPEHAAPATPNAAESQGDATLPGAHRGGYARALTAPTPVPTVETHPDAERPLRWAPVPEPPEILPRAGGWALTFGVLALVLSLFVGWGFVVGVVGGALAIIALRRPWESRELAVWALCLSGLSLLYSAGWLWWAWTQGDLFAGT